MLTSELLALDVYERSQEKAVVGSLPDQQAATALPQEKSDKETAGESQPEISSDQAKGEAVPAGPSSSSEPAKMDELKDSVEVVPAEKSSV